MRREAKEESVVGPSYSVVTGLHLFSKQTSLHKAKQKPEHSSVKATNSPFTKF